MSRGLGDTYMRREQTYIRGNFHLTHIISQQVKPFNTIHTFSPLHISHQPTQPFPTPLALIFRHYRINRTQKKASAHLPV